MFQTYSYDLLLKRGETEGLDHDVAENVRENANG